MKLRHFAFFIIIILLGVLLVRNAGKLSQFVELLHQLNIWVLLLIIPARYGYYWFNTRYYSHFFSLFDKPGIIPKKELFQGVVSMNFVNTVIPSGGLSGAAFFAKIYEDKITNRESFLAQFFWYIATFLSLVLCLALSFTILLFSNAIAQVSFRLVLFIIVLCLFAALITVALTLNEWLLEKVLFIVTRPINWVLKLIKKGSLSEKEVERFVTGFHELVQLFSRQPREGLRPFLDALACIGCEVLSIFIVYLAFGELVNPGMIGAAYVFALLFSTLSFFTSGVGLYEATMVAVSVALGVPLSLAISVTAVYRLVALWLFIPIGLLLYKRQTLDTPVLKDLVAEGKRQRGK